MTATDTGTEARAVALPDEAATLTLAAQLASAMPPAAPLVVHLTGDLGAGKTCMARGMLRALGETGPVRSPTYGLVADYDTPRGRVLHLDLYRLRSPDELTTLGLADLWPGSRLWLIEWPERGAGPELPAADLQLALTVTGQARGATLIPATDMGRRWLAAWTAGASS